MLELGIEKYIPIDPLHAPSVSATPSFMFFGEEFETDENFSKLRNLFLDFFHAEVCDYKNLQSLEHVISLTAREEKIYFRVYQIKLKNSGSKIPKVELHLAGPSIDFVLRRTKFASRDLIQMATKHPKPTVFAKQKNIEHNELRGKYGQIHMPRQDLSEISLRKRKKADLSDDGGKKNKASLESKNESQKPKKKQKTETNVDI